MFSTSTGVGSAGELPHSQSASDLHECTRLPLVIRERDVEYQVCVLKFLFDVG